MAYYAPPCESYFVKSHESQECLVKEGIRECERQKKQQTQAAIAEELSLLTSDEYRDDVQLHMESMEVNRLGPQPLYPANLLSSSRPYQT